MSQQDVYNILKSLKGEATTKQIREIAKTKYPNRTLYLYILDRLKKLEKNDLIINVEEKWKIVKK